jgi:hypothetical protein
MYYARRGAVYYVVTGVRARLEPVDRFGFFTVFTATTNEYSILLTFHCAHASTTSARAPTG